MNTKEQEFLSLIEQHKGILHKVSKMYMSNVDDQKDLFQEMVYQIWKAYESFRTESQFSTWMYRVAINTAIVFYKKESKKIGTYDIPAENIAEEKSYTEEKEAPNQSVLQSCTATRKIRKSHYFLPFTRLLA